jgi:CMP-N-acetylneuraminic acid synthetase
MDNITIVIPCRAGSTRVKNKNFKPFANSSLLEIKIKQAKTLGLPVVIRF